MALALGEDGNEHVGAGHLLASGRLHVDDGALDDALEASGRLGVLARAGGEVGEFGIDVLDQIAAQHVEIDVARAHHRSGVLILDQRQKQMLQRGVFLVALAGERQRLMQSSFKAARE